MNHEHAHHVHAPAQPAPAGHGGSLNRLAWSATLHCLTGCAIGEILGMVIGTALGWSNLETIALSVVLAFFFGYSLTMRPMLVSGMPLRQAAKLALAADTASITIMEIVVAIAALIGGVKAQIGSMIYDGTIRNQLTKMRERLTQ